MHKRFILLGILLLTSASASAYAASVPAPNEACDNVRALFVSGSYDEGSRELVRLRESMPNMECLTDLEWLQARSCRNYFEAARLYRQLIDTRSQSKYAPTALMELALLYLSGSDSMSAETELRRLLTQYPNSPESPLARLSLGKLQLAAGRFPAAANEFAAFLQIDFDNPARASAEFGLAEAKYQTGAVAEAKGLYKKLLQTHDTEIDISHVLFRLAEMAEKQQDVYSAVRYYRAIATVAPRGFYSDSARSRLEALKDFESETAASPMFSMPFGQESWAVLIGRFSGFQAAKESEPYRKAGFTVTLRIAPDDATEVLIGSFATEIQARFFAEELEKKYNRPMQVVPLQSVGNATTPKKNDSMN